MKILRKQKDNTADTQQKHMVTICDESLGEKKFNYRLENCVQENLSPKVEENELPLICQNSTYCWSKQTI